MVLGMIRTHLQLILEQRVAHMRSVAAMELVNKLYHRLFTA